MFFGRTYPTQTQPAFVYEVEINDPPPPGLQIQDPIVLIRYSLKGEEQEYGLRLDLDKQVFIDSLGDEEQDRVLKEMAPQTVEFLSSVLEMLEK